MSIKWDGRFLDLARYIAAWSKDPSTQCGAVIVDSHRRIRGVGYNGFPRGVHDDAARYADRETKYRMVVHAEANAIMNAANVKSCTVYVWPYPPCCECAKLLIQSGVSCVVAPMPDAAFVERWGSSLKAASVMFEEAGIPVELVEL